VDRARHAGICPHREAGEVDAEIVW
jgi:hypothetical protein